MNIEGYGPFPFELGDIIREKGEPGETAKITSAEYNYVWFEMLDGDYKGQTLCTRTERVVVDWEKVEGGQAA